MLRLLAGALVLVFSSTLALAHPMPNSVVTLDIGEASVNAEIAIPLIELDLALGTRLAADPEAAVAAASALLSDYLSVHTRVDTPDGTAWSVAVGDIAAETDERSGTATAEIVAHLVLTPPAGASPRAFVLRYDGVMHRVLTHYALVVVRQDWMGGLVGTDHSAPKQLGVLRINPVDGQLEPLRVDVSDGSYWAGFVSLFQLGMAHIGEGTDHVLFLLTLLLPAPLLASARRWQGYAGPRQTLVSILKIVTAFTIGHSFTLVLASALALQLPQQPVEVAIALTILVSAVHAIRPLFPGREAVIAGVFGLIHGMAFSFVLAEMQLPVAQLAVSLLGFNLGIEVMQLAIVAISLPALMLMASSRWYTPLRLAGAGLAAVAAIVWLAERLGVPVSVSGLDETMNGSFLPFIMGLTLLGVLVRLTGRRQQA
jgi:hypothetical protein